MISPSGHPGERGVLEGLKRAFLCERDRTLEEVVRVSRYSFEKRLREIVKVAGGHFA